MSEDIKFPGEDRFRGVITPYLRNLLNARQLEELLEWAEDGVFDPRMTQYQAVTLAKTFF